MISVCMATYNGEKYIREQIESIICQLGKEDELIVSDDGSSDRTIQIIKSINDKRIKIIFSNGSTYTENFENALNHSKGDYIFLCDQDDIWLENKVEVSIGYLRKYDFLMSNAMVVDEKLNVFIESRNDYLDVTNGFIRNLYKTRYLGCCMAFKRSVLNMAIPFPKKRDLCLHDVWLALISERYFKTYVCQEKLILYRRHNSNVSNGSLGGRENNLLKILKIRSYLLIQLFLRRVYFKGSGGIE